MKKLFLLLCFCLVLLGNTYADVINMGYGATTTSLSTSGITCITADNPANLSGTIDNFEVYIVSKGASSGDMYFGGFTNTSGNSFTANNYETYSESSLSVGLNSLDAPSDFTAFEITAGQYLGVYTTYDGAYIAQQIGAGTNYWWRVGNKFTIVNYSMVNTYDPAALYFSATGVTSGGEPDPVRRLIMLSQINERNNQ